MFEYERAISYHLDGGLTDAALNEYGRAGWELVSVVAVGDDLLYIFKRYIQHEI